MKSFDFFLGKAIEYSNSIDEILQNYQSSNSQGFDPTPEFREQNQKISDLKLKVKLLFTEFDNGEFFKDRVVSIDEDKWLGFIKQGEPLKQYKHVLSLFIEHINEFRK